MNADCYPVGHSFDARPVVGPNRRGGVFTKSSPRWFGPCFLSIVGIVARVFAEPEGSYLYLGKHPDEARPGWHDNAQGLGHDDNHWFITQAHAVWKVPVTHNLASAASGAPGVTRRTFSDYPALRGYDHFGDGEHFEFSGVGYFFVAIEGSDPCGAVAVLRGSSLSYLDHTCVHADTEPRFRDAPWCALDAEGVLYVSISFDLTVVKRFRINWPTLRDFGQLQLTALPGLTLNAENGQPLVLDRVQGGVLSPSGSLLYLSAGSSGFGLGTPDEVPTDGIHVFDTRTGRRVQRSTDGHGYFNFEFHSGFPRYEEPEGLTIWDLDDGRSPGVSGQLHVVLLDNETISDNDQVYVKHYTHTISVDRTYQGEESGTPAHPFNTVTEANQLAWNGCQISIRAGTYNERLTFSKSMYIRARGGSAVIGR